MKTILVTGSTGFIGKNIKESFLSQKYNLLCPTHAELDLLDRVKTLEYFRGHDIDVVVNAATSPLALETVAMYYNVQLAASLSYNTRIINLNSGAIYDRYRNLTNIKECQIGDNIPIDDYGMSKYTCYQLRKENTIDLILFGVFGKYEKPFRFIPKVVKDLLSGRQPVVNPRSMDFVCVKDVIRILDMLIEQGWTVPALNISSDSFVYLPWATLDLMDRLDTYSISFVPTTTIEKTYTGSGDLLRTLYDFKFTPMDEALDEYVSYLKEDFYAKRAT